MSNPLPNEERLRALGDQIVRARGKHRRRSSPGKRRLKIAALSLILAFVLVIGAGAGYFWYLNGRIHRINVKTLKAQLTAGALAGSWNILMVGSTDRCALQVQTPAFGLCTQGVNGINSDVVMILHLDPNGPHVSVLSIPRDLFVPNARTTGANKIDAALDEGPTQLVSVIEEDFAIPINAYVELNFDTFASVVTAIGGITMYFPEPVFDAESGLNVRTVGCHHLNGFEALQVVRARHLQYKSPTTTSTTPSTWPPEAQSDLARIRRDHEFLRVLATTVSKRGLGNPLTDEQLIAGVAPQLTVSGISTTTMVTMILTYHSVSIGSAPQLTVPVAVDNFGTYSYEGGAYGDIEFPSQPADQNAVNAFLGVTNTTNTMSGKPLPAPGSVTVSVLNGSGAANQPTTAATALGGLGFDVVGTGSTTVVASEVETTVTYAHRTTADEAAAQLVARSLSGSVIMKYGPTSDGADVTVTTGTGFTVNPTLPLKPHTAPPASSSSSSTTTTSAPPPGGAPSTTTTTVPTPSTSGPSTSSLTSQFTQPSSPNEPLAAWDPRSCGPGGAPGP